MLPDGRGGLHREGRDQSQGPRSSSALTRFSPGSAGSVHSQRLQNARISRGFHSSAISSFSFRNLSPLLGSVVHFPRRVRKPLALSGPNGPLGLILSSRLLPDGLGSAVSPRTSSELVHGSCRPRSCEAHLSVGAPGKEPEAAGRVRLLHGAPAAQEAGAGDSRAVSRGGGWGSRCGGWGWSGPLQRVLREIGSVHITCRGRAETCLSPLKVTPRSTPELGPEPEPWAVAARVTGPVPLPPLCAHGGPAGFPLLLFCSAASLDV
ncbi:unnamed protein product [Rangifer tarandus platyrhynchus]|uniref:Uncharacterized protein n=1 Tax=Rangifer tarandus platyrhynchus TaxID=3082113 RepID=A0AC59ZP96_RANTA